MVSLEKSARFCVFCYRSGNHSTKTLAESKNLNLFIKLIERFNGQSDTKHKTEMQLDQLLQLSLSNLLGCCEGCLVTVNGFCDIYHQFKSLEMQLEWKIDRLVNTIKLANRVPSRISQVIKMLQTDNKIGLPDKTKNGKLNVVRTFRHGLVKQCKKIN